MAYGIDKLARQIGEDVEADVASLFGSLDVQFQSPIERLMVTGLHMMLRCGDSYYELHSRISGGLPDADSFQSTNLAISSQVQVAGFRADFVLSVVDEGGAVHRVVVECDGHDFHERTKEQAARDRSRDRAVQALGFTIMRFTGSELYRDPRRCVREVLDWCLAKAWGGRL